MIETSFSLEWVIYNGKLHHVSYFSVIDKGQRPIVYCPECNNRVILKLGDKRKHHVAHYPENLCKTTVPETAMHLNVKYYIAEKLRDGNNLKILKNCGIVDYINDFNSPEERYSHFCNETRIVSVCSDWDRVEIEHQFDVFRLDIALLKDNNLIACIEIFVTHSIEEKKRIFLSKNNIPLIQIPINEKNYKSIMNWTFENPLKPDISENIGQAWICNQHIYQFAEIRKLRIVDYYFPSGKKFRDIFFIKQYQDSVFLFSDNDGFISDLTKEYIEKDVIILANNKLRNITKRKKSFTKAIIDSPMDWHQKIEDLNLYNKHVLPFLYRFSKKNGWFKPEGIKNFKWDGYWLNKEEYYNELDTFEDNAWPNRPPNIAKKDPEHRKY